MIFSNSPEVQLKSMRSVTGFGFCLSTLMLACIGSSCKDPDVPKPQNKIQVFQETRIHVGSESCKLGDVIIGDPTTRKPARCVSFSPVTADSPDCTNWKDSSHTKVIDALGSVGDLAARVSTATSVTPNGLHSTSEAKLSLVRSAIGVGIQIPIEAVNVGLKSKYGSIDLVVSLTRYYVELGKDQLKCMESQGKADIEKSVQTEAKEAILGFVSKADIGFTQALHLTGVEIGAQVSEYVELSAGHFSISNETHGSMQPQYLEGMKKLLTAENLVGKNAAAISTELLANVDHISQPVTIFVAMKSFPKLKQVNVDK